MTGSAGQIINKPSHRDVKFRKMPKKDDSMQDSEISVIAVGDVVVNRKDPASLFAHVTSVIKSADVAFCHLEGLFSKKGNPQVYVQEPSLPYSLRADPQNAVALTHAGFDVVSAGSNHTLDWGFDGLLDTIDTCERLGIKVIGAGRNIIEARKPAILDESGTRVAFLAYCSVLPRGYEAGPNKIGAAPLRASTSYEAVNWQAGVPPKVVTVADKGDMDAMGHDIKAAKKHADVVVISMHWGVHLIPSIIAMYQREAAHFAIDQGADIIVGHHAHVLKGVEVYKGKAIFYSMGNFAVDCPRGVLPGSWKDYRWEIDPEYQTYNFPPEARKSMIVKFKISNKRINRVGFLPIIINKSSQPEVATGARAEEVLSYVKWLCKDQHLETTFSKNGKEIVLDGIVG